MYIETRNNYTFGKLAGVIIGTLIFFTALSVHAYFTTNQDATTFTEKTLLFTVEYQFGHKEHEIILPVLAENSETLATNTISYSILDHSGHPAKGLAQGIVFSNATLTNNGMYTIKKNELASFSLTVLFTPQVLDSEEKYRLQVTNLPFSFDGAQELRLNPSELQYYTTDFFSR